MIDLSGMYWTVGATGFRTNSIITGKCKKEKDVKEKSDLPPLNPSTFNLDNQLIIVSPGRAAIVAPDQRVCVERSDNSNSVRH